MKYLLTFLEETLNLIKILSLIWMIVLIPYCIIGSIEEILTDKEFNFSSSPELMSNLMVLPFILLIFWGTYQLHKLLKEKSQKMKVTMENEKKDEKIKVTMENEKKDEKIKELWERGIKNTPKLNQGKTILFFVFFFVLFYIIFLLNGIKENLNDIRFTIPSGYDDYNLRLKLNRIEGNLEDIEEHLEYIKILQ